MAQGTARDHAAEKNEVLNPANPAPRERMIVNKVGLVKIRRYDGRDDRENPWPSGPFTINIRNSYISDSNKKGPLR